MNILIPYLHYIGIMALMGSLIAEHLILKPNIAKQQVKQLGVVDMIYIISTVTVLVTGLLRWFFVDPKGDGFFNTNPLFHIKLTLFVVMAVLSIFPTMKFLRWNRQLKNGETVEVTESAAKKQLMFIRIELLLLAIIPLLAVMVASGVRM